LPNGGQPSFSSDNGDDQLQDHRGHDDYGPHHPEEDHGHKGATDPHHPPASAPKLNWLLEERLPVIEQKTYDLFRGSTPTIECALRHDGKRYAGAGSIQAPPGTIRCTITDRNTLNDTLLPACQ